VFLTRWLLQGLPSHQTGAIPIYPDSQLLAKALRSAIPNLRFVQVLWAETCTMHCTAGIISTSDKTPKVQDKLTHRLCTSMALASSQQAAKRSRDR
jgi:hypothetical protein